MAWGTSTGTTFHDYVHPPAADALSSRFLWNPGMSKGFTSDEI